mmetsp:Transcript_38745/g.50126  ORF Transcript_38745/g.50126 Transcript_38745/m.50126 type:complete len:145 (+) Transcript_38745:554-988(+)
MLSDEKMRNTFLESVKIQMSDNPEGSSKLQQLQNIMKMAAAEVLPRIDRRRARWFDDSRSNLIPLIEARNTARGTYIKRRTERNRQLLQNARKKVKKAVAAAQRKWIKCYVDRISQIPHRRAVQDNANYHFFIHRQRLGRELKS